MIVACDFTAYCGRKRLLTILVLPVLLAGVLSGCSSVSGRGSQAAEPLVNNDARLNSAAEEAASATSINRIARKLLGAFSRQTPQPEPTALAQHPASPQLDVGIVSFVSTPAVTDGAVEGSTETGADGEFPLVRRAECRYLPFLLRQTLVRQADRPDVSPWGVVRVMPESHAAMELLVEGQILVSNGEQLQLRVVARDSSERVWVDKVYQHKVAAQAYQLGEHELRRPGNDPFQPLFDQVAADLRLAWSQLSGAQLQEIRQLAQLRYGEQLSADAFAGFYREDEQGQLQLLRLPARDDPMLRRVDRLRKYEYFFIDTADEQYANLFAQMQETYWRWRQYSRELALYIRDFRAREEGKSSGYRRGSLASMNEVYGDYEWFRLQQRDLRELASGFNNEVLPTVLNLDDDVVQLNGDLASQYEQWRNILAEIFRLEQGGL